MTVKEAKFARLHPKLAVSKCWVSGIGKELGKAGMKEIGFAAGLACTGASVGSLIEVSEGKMTSEQLVNHLLKEGGGEAFDAAGAQLVSAGVEQAMKPACEALFKSATKFNLPMAAADMALESFGTINSFTRGEISPSQFAYELGEDAVSSAGRTIGTLVGGGSSGGLGTIPGAMVGSAVAAEIYRTAIGNNSEDAAMALGKAQEYADLAIDTAAAEMPSKLNEIKTAFADFAKEADIPLKV